MCCYCSKRVAGVVAVVEEEASKQTTTTAGNNVVIFIVSTFRILCVNSDIFVAVKEGPVPNNPTWNFFKMTKKRTGFTFTTH